MSLILPRPPANLVSMTGLTAPDRFEPAPELVDWIRAAYLEPDGPLFCDEHGHLRSANIGVLWTNAENVYRGKRIVGQAEAPTSYVKGGSGAWRAGRRQQQLREWFHVELDFLITLDAVYASQVEDIRFAALVDHELCHMGQREDEFGMPMFDKVTGRPKFCLKAHDVEEFVSVVRRFGIEAAGQKAVDFVMAAAQKPTIGRAQIAGACGSCLRVAA